MCTFSVNFFSPPQCNEQAIIDFTRKQWPKKKKKNDELYVYALWESCADSEQERKNCYFEPKPFMPRWMINDSLSQTPLFQARPIWLLSTPSQPQRSYQSHTQVITSPDTVWAIVHVTLKLCWKKRLSWLTGTECLLPSQRRKSLNHKSSNY